MKKPEDFIKKFNFKKAVKVYILISIMLLTICGIGLGYSFKDKINTAINYERLRDGIKKNGMTSTTPSDITKLFKGSNDIDNIVIVDKDNNITLKINDKIIGGLSKFDIISYKDGVNNRQSDKYVQENNTKQIFKIASHESFLFDKDIIKREEEKRFNEDEDYFLGSNNNGKTITNLNYIIDNKTDSKVFIMLNNIGISNYSEILVKGTGIVVGIIFILYWIGLALWVCKDAMKRQSNAALWGIITILTNLAGLLLYILVRQNSGSCNHCGAIQNRYNKFCTKCGFKMSKCCNKCDNIVDKKDVYCNSCGEKL